MAALVFFVLGYAVQCAQVQYLETQGLWLLQGWHTPFLDGLAIGLAYAGSMPGLLAALLGLMLWVKIKQQDMLLLLPISGIVGMMALGWLAKGLFMRPRPEVWPPLVAYYGASFPSNHSAYAMVLAGLVLAIYALLLQPADTRLSSQGGWAPALLGLPVWLRMLAVGWWVLMGLSRLYLGAHFFTDVVAGWCLGLAWLCLLLWCFIHFNFFKSRAGIPAGQDEVT